jgi:hypothetical protein
MSNQLRSPNIATNAITEVHHGDACSTASSSHAAVIEDCLPNIPFAGATPTDTATTMPSVRKKHAPSHPCEVLNETKLKMYGKRESI